MITTNGKDALCVLGNLYLEYRRCDEALAVLEGVYELFPGDFSVGVILARALLAAEDARRAVSVTTQLLAKRRAPHEEGLLLLLKGRALAKAGERDLAARALEAALPEQSRAAAA